MNARRAVLDSEKPQEWQLATTEPERVTSDYNTKRDVFVLVGDQRHRLVDYNREWLEATPIEEELPASQLVTHEPEGVTHD